jgi:hypothetical protein
MVGTPGIPDDSPSGANKNRNLQARRAPEVASKSQTRPVAQWAQKKKQTKKDNDPLGRRERAFPASAFLDREQEIHQGVQDKARPGPKYLANEVDPPTLGRDPLSKPHKEKELGRFYRREGRKVRMASTGEFLSFPFLGGYGASILFDVWA